MKKKIISFFIMLLMILTMAAPSFSLYAEPGDNTDKGNEKETFFAEIKEGDVFLVYAEWENSQPTIKFRSPSGVIYDTSEAKEGTHLSLGEGELYYQIDEPEVGKWNVIYDKKDNATISIDLEEATKPFIVEGVKVTNITGYGATVSFQATFDGYVKFNYKISVTATNGSAGEVVYEGVAYTNEDVTASIDLHKFGSYSDYKVYVYAYYQKDGVDIGEGAYSEAFSFTNANIIDMQTPVALIVKPDEYTVNVTLEKNYNYSYLIAYYTDDKTEPDYYMEVDSDGNKRVDYG